MFLATCPDDTLRDGRRALELAQQAQQLPAREELPCLAALAAAYAELGIFDRAVEFGRRAVEVAPSRLRARHEARLAGYEARQPYRDWPPQEPGRKEQ
jgi:tetratricopeptide (TPR) repeat protein